MTWITMLMVAMLGYVLYANDSGLLIAIVWPAIFAMQCRTWYMRGRMEGMR